MVDEFSAFARMPQPHMKTVNLSDLCRQSVFLEQNRYPDINYETVLPEQAVTLFCDRQQISQVLTNLLKNAAESVCSAVSETGIPAEQDRITVTLQEGVTELKIVVADTGAGFAEDLLDRVTEPYVTTRDKGTGLGLAIVKKIIEDHSGELILANKAPSGATAELKFFRTREPKNAVTEDKEEVDESTTDMVMN